MGRRGDGTYVPSRSTPFERRAPAARHRAAQALRRDGGVCPTSPTGAPRFRFHSIRATLAHDIRPRSAENRLGRETSPYLLQHKDNPVHWWAWGPEALAEAKRSTSRSCCRSATPPATGATSWRTRASRMQPPRRVMNELFVNIKVDREERPDIDAIYMRALHSLGEQGGWPLTMFLDSEARPVLGRHLLPAGAALRPARLPARAARGLPRLRRGARQGHPQRRHAGRRARTRARRRQGHAR